MLIFHLDILALDYDVELFSHMISMYVLSYKSSDCLEAAAGGHRALLAGGSLHLLARRGHERSRRAHRTGPGRGHGRAHARQVWLC